MSKEKFKLRLRGKWINGEDEYITQEDAIKAAEEESKHSMLTGYGHTESVIGVFKGPFTDNEFDYGILIATVEPKIDINIKYF